MERRHSLSSNLRKNKAIRLKNNLEGKEMSARGTEMGKKPSIKAGVRSSVLKSQRRHVVGTESKPYAHEVRIKFAAQSSAERDANRASNQELPDGTPRHKRQVAVVSQSASGLAAPTQFVQPLRTSRDVGKQLSSDSRGDLFNQDGPRLQYQKSSASVIQAPDKIVTNISNYDRQFKRRKNGSDRAAAVNKGGNSNEDEVNGSDIVRTGPPVLSHQKNPSDFPPNLQQSPSVIAGSRKNRSHHQPVVQKSFKLHFMKSPEKKEMRNSIGDNVQTQQPPPAIAAKDVTAKLRRIAVLNRSREQIRNPNLNDGTNVDTQRSSQQQQPAQVFKVRLAVDGATPRGGFMNIMQLEKAAGAKPNYLSTGSKVIPLKNKLGQKSTRRNEPYTDSNINMAPNKQVQAPELVSGEQIVPPSAMKRSVKPISAGDNDMMNTTIHEIIRKQQEQIMQKAIQQNRHTGHYKTEHEEAQLRRSAEYVPNHQLDLVPETVLSGEVQTSRDLISKQMFDGKKLLSSRTQLKSKLIGQSQQAPQAMGGLSRKVSAVNIAQGSSVVEHCETSQPLVSKYRVIQQPQLNSGTQSGISKVGGGLVSSTALLHAGNFSSSQPNLMMVPSQFQSNFASQPSLQQQLSQVNLPVALSQQNAQSSQRQQRSKQLTSLRHDRSSVGRQNQVVAHGSKFKSQHSFNMKDSIHKEKLEDGPKTRHASRVRNNFNSQVKIMEQPRASAREDVRISDRKVIVNTNNGDLTSRGRFARQSSNLRLQSKFTTSNQQARALLQDEVPSATHRQAVNHQRLIAGDRQSTQKPIKQVQLKTSRPTGMLAHGKSEQHLSCPPDVVQKPSSQPAALQSKQMPARNNNIVESQIRFRSNIEQLTRSKAVSKNVSRFDEAKASLLAASAAKSASNSIGSQKSAEQSKMTSGNTTRQHHYFNNTNCKSSKFLQSKATNMENNLSSGGRLMSNRKSSLESLKSKSGNLRSGRPVGMISSKQLQHISSARKEILLSSSNQITQKPIMIDQGVAGHGGLDSKLSKVREIDQKPSMLVDERQQNDDSDYDTTQRQETKQEQRETFLKQTHKVHQGNWGEEGEKIVEPIEPFVPSAAPAVVPEMKPPSIPPMPATVLESVNIKAKLQSNAAPHPPLSQMKRPLPPKVRLERSSSTARNPVNAERARLAGQLNSPKFQNLTSKGSRVISKNSRVQSSQKEENQQRGKIASLSSIKKNSSQRKFHRQLISLSNTSLSHDPDRPRASGVIDIFGIGVPDFPDVLLDSGIQAKPEALEQLNLVKYKTDLEMSKAQKILEESKIEDVEPARQQTPQLFSGSRAAPLPSEIGGNSSQIKFEKNLLNEVDNLFEFSQPSTVVRKFEPAPQPDEFENQIHQSQHQMMLQQKQLRQARHNVGLRQSFYANVNIAQKQNDNQNGAYKDSARSARLTSATHNTAAKFTGLKLKQELIVNTATERSIDRKDADIQDANIVAQEAYVNDDEMLSGEQEFISALENSIKFIDQQKSLTTSQQHALALFDKSYSASAHFSAQIMSPDAAKAVWPRNSDELNQGSGIDNQSVSSVQMLMNMQKGKVDNNESGGSPNKFQQLSQRKVNPLHQLADAFFGEAGAATEADGAVDVVTPTLPMGKRLLSGTSGTTRNMIGNSFGEKNASPARSNLKQANAQYLDGSSFFKNSAFMQGEDEPSNKS